MLKCEHGRRTFHGSLVGWGQNKCVPLSRASALSQLCVCEDETKVKVKALNAAPFVTRLLTPSLLPRNTIFKSQGITLTSSVLPQEYYECKVDVCDLEQCFTEEEEEEEALVTFSQLFCCHNILKGQFTL